MSSRSSTTDPDSESAVTVGLVRKPHGVRGEVTVESHSDAPGRFAAGSRLLLEVPGVAPREVTVHSSRPHRSGFLVGFEGIDDRNLAEELRGGVLSVSREEVGPAPEGEYYFFELVGCACSDRSRGELGTVTEVVEDGGGEILIVEDATGNWLVPFVEAYLVTMDTAGRRIELDLPEGLLDACRFES